MRMSHLPLAATSLALAASVGCAVQAARGAREGQFNRTLTVTGPVRLAVETRSGNISIHRGADGQVRVAGRIRPSTDLFSDVTDGDIARIEANPPVRQQGNSIALEQVVSL